MAAQQVHSIMALDIGEQRTGVALANSVAKIANPLVTLQKTADLTEAIKQLIKQYDVTTLVVGLPRGLQGQETNQTAYVRQVVGELETQLVIPIHLVDEAATSVKAEAELKTRKKPYQKEDIDMLAAAYILEDFLHEHTEELGV